MITLLIVDYKSPDKTWDYIERFVAAAHGQEFRVLLVDNSDTGDCRKFCENNKKSVQYIEESSVKDFGTIFEVKGEDIPIFCVEVLNNLGYARGNNLGVKVAQELWKETRVIISNNDLEFPEGIDFEAYEKVLEENPDVAVVGPQVVTPKGEVQSPHVKVGIGKALIFRYPCLLFCSGKKDMLTDVQNFNESGYVYWVTGCFMYIHVDRFVKSGMFDEQTFLYCEEKILAERMAKNNLKMYFLKTQIVVHNHGQTVKNTMSTLAVSKIGFHSAIYYYKKYLHTSWWKLLLAQMSFFFYTILYPIKCHIKRSVESKIKS